MNFLLIAIFAESSAGKNPLTAVTPGLYIWTIITFLLLFYVLAKFAWKPLLSMLEERENLIKRSLIANMVKLKFIIIVVLRGVLLSFYVL